MYRTNLWSDRTEILKRLDPELNLYFCLNNKEFKNKKSSNRNNKSPSKTLQF